MKEHEKILKLIEEVDPNDTAMLDEIDARVSCYINERAYKSHKTRDNDYRLGWPDITVETENKK